MTHDLIIRNGTIVDGLGGDPFVGDVAVSGGVITAVGVVDGSGRRAIDATGLLVTPGFVDLHTHYDGQAIWSDRMTPSSAHGVIAENGAPTAARPGKLVRGRQPAPAL